jgi:hypothetical protein
MTRPAQKESERRTLNGVMAALDLRPDQEPQEGEAPDFIIPVAGRLIGIEITAYRSGDSADDGRPRRAVEAEWEKNLKRTADAFRGQHPELCDIHVGLMFKDAVPPRRRHTAFLEEIAAFVHSHAAEITAENREYWPPNFVTPLMQAYLRTLYLRRDRHADWYTNLAAGYVARPDATIATWPEASSPRPTAMAARCSRRRRKRGSSRC